MSSITCGPQRRLRCRHTPTGTVAWPAPGDWTPGEHAVSVYSCSRPMCVDDAAQYVHTKTGHPGAYHPFTDTEPTRKGRPRA